MKDRFVLLFLTTAIIAAAAGLAGCSGDDGNDGTAGTSCTVTQNDDGTATIECTDGTDAVVAPGTDGADGLDGETCTLEDNDDGTKTITCGDGTVIVTDGENGTDGTDGTDGADGVEGADGTSCSVTDNGDGTRTIECEDGSSVTVADGEDGEAGGNAAITEFMGTDYLLTSGEFAEGKFFADVVITGATADPDGNVTVDFTVNNRADAAPVLNLASASVTFAKLVPASGDVSFNSWVSYIYRQQTIVAGDWPNPVGTSAWQANRQSNGTLTNNGDGSYTYALNGPVPYVYEGGPAVTYERNLTHRISVMMGGHSGATGNADFDFVPDGSAMTEMRSIVETETCQNCHGWDFNGHGGDRLTTDNCVTCHNPGNIDPNGGETVDMTVMIHRIHAGYELPRVPGDDGIVFDDPATVGVDESADNGEYAIWGNRDTKHEWGKVGYPAVLANCQSCHQGEGAQVENWREVPSREACGSCHEDVNFADGTNHAGGAAANDDGCALCHPADGNGLGQSVTRAHNWLTKDPRNIPEFDVNATLSPPANGEYYVDGEAPLVTITTNDANTGALIDGTTIIEDAAAEGCPHVDANADGVWDPCPARDGLFRSFAFFVSGPRAVRNPVLTTAARSQLFSTVAPPFAIAANGNLEVVFDQGAAVHTVNEAGGDVLRVGRATVAFVAGSFTVDQVVATLNANAAFAARGIAWNDNGRVGVRSRNLGPVFGIQLTAGAVNTAIFNDTVVHMPGGYTPSNNLTARTNPANNDPKATRSAGGITYQLDAVDDLAPGTYVLGLEVTDGGRVDAVNYRTPSVFRTTFQVGAADEEPLIARNCSTCHQGPDGPNGEYQGFILDFSRHYKEFDDTSVDLCGNCHDYQPQANNSVGGGSLGWTGSRPISRRVHGIHMGSELNYPLWTVDYSNGDPIPGRNWDIGFPQDIRNCETCHTAETSGTWHTNPSRLACSGCHDSDASISHMRIQTFDPTPNDPWSGDEVESCATCHAAP